MGNPDERALPAPDDIDGLDTAALRSELRQARERLALHDGFDRVIAENVRRTREMLDAASALRASAIGGLPAEDRERIAVEIAGLQRVAESMSTAVSEFQARISALQASLDTPVEEPRHDRVLNGNDVASPSESREASRDLDLIVHGVADAGSALSLQRDLQELVGVQAATPREYAEGILRLRLTVAGGTNLATLAGPDSGVGLEVLHQAPGVIECVVASAAART